VYLFEEDADSSFSYTEFASKSMIDFIDIRLVADYCDKAFFYAIRLLVQSGLIP